MMNGKREPIGWMGPSGQKSYWRVIDSRGQRIASGFTTRALALRWIDGLNLLRAGYQISDDDHEWIFFALALGTTSAPGPGLHASTESGGHANVPTSSAEDESGAEGAGGRRRQPQTESAGNAAPIAPRDHRGRAIPGTVKMASHQVSRMTTRP